MTVIDIVGVGFNGSLVTEFGLLSRLEKISLSYNRLRGSVPRELMELPRLRVLELADNQLSGNFTANVTLLHCHVDRNCFQACSTVCLCSTSPDWKCPGRQKPLSSLEHAALMKITEAANPQRPERFGMSEPCPTIVDSRGEPQFLCPNGSLVALSLFFNGGSISTSIAALTSLTSLAFLGVGMIGTIVTEIGSLTELRRLRIQGPVANGFILSRFVGTFPSQIGRLQKLQELRVFGADLTGTLPASLLELSALTKLSVTDTPLRGSLQFSPNITDCDFRGSCFDFCRPGDCRCGCICMENWYWVNPSCVGIYGYPSPSPTPAPTILTTTTTTVAPTTTTTTVAPTTTSTATTTTTTTFMAPTPATSAPTSPPTTTFQVFEPDLEPPSGNAVGIGVGVAVALLVVLSGAAFAFWLYRRQRHYREARAYVPGQTPTAAN